jgi:2-dehydropantoate 2-reductase
MKIAVVGIGGVGGYYGGLLAKHYHLDGNTEIVFVARGGQLTAIRRQGLRLLHAGGDFTVQPDMATDMPRGGIFDMVLFCVKSYSLAYSARILAGSIGADTIVVSLLNGVDNAVRLRKVLPDAIVLNGCVYLSAHVAGPGFVRQVGGSGQLFFGSPAPTGYGAGKIEAVLRAAGIDAVHTEDIERVVWEKFLFIAPLAGATAYTERTVGEVVSDPESRGLLEALLGELLAVADALGLKFAGTIRQDTLKKAHGFPPQTKTSLQLDFEKGNRTELETFTGFTVREAHRLGIPIPLHEKVYTRLQAKEMPAD